MSNLSLPYNIIQDQQNQVKASSTHVQGNFSALETAVNSRLDLDGSNSPTADISMASHKLTNLATPTISGDATTKGYVDSALLLKADLANPTFTGTPKAPTVATVTDNSDKIATTKFVVDVLKAMYPVGAVYIGTQNTCPMSAFFGTWTLVATNRALWGGNGTNGNTTIEAGLPNITGKMAGEGVNSDANPAQGCFRGERDDDYGGAAYGYGKARNYFDASRSNSIYGNSTTVQPPAYRVNVWRRTA